MAASRSASPYFPLLKNGDTYVNLAHVTKWSVGRARDGAIKAVSVFLLDGTGYKFEGEQGQAVLAFLDQYKPVLDVTPKEKSDE